MYYLTITNLIQNKNLFYFRWKYTIKILKNNEFENQVTLRLVYIYFFIEYFIFVYICYFIVILEICTIIFISFLLEFLSLWTILYKYWTKH